MITECDAKVRLLILVMDNGDAEMESLLDRMPTIPEQVPYRISKISVSEVVHPRKQLYTFDQNDLQAAFTWLFDR